MNISVEYIDTTGAVFSRTYYMSRLAFAKHLAIAGQGYAPRPQKLMRTLGMFFHYSYYTQQAAFDNNRFSEPPNELSDPNEKGQFSNLAAKAIADFLSKRIGNSLFTVNYEAAMRLRGLPIVGQKPDLLAYSPSSMFAVESKGRSQTNPGNMIKHKSQAQSGPISVNYSIACVSYNLYNQVTCNYHDPFNGDIEYDTDSLRTLTRNYYSGLSEFLKGSLFEYREIEIQGEAFYEVELSYRSFRKFLPDELRFRHLWDFEIFEYYRPSLILPQKIFEYAENGITNQIEPFNFEINQDRNLYIDNDRVGLQIRR